MIQRERSGLTVDTSFEPIWQGRDAQVASGRIPGYVAAVDRIVGPGGSWGLGAAVDIENAEPWMAPGRWGWTGGTGTTAYVDRLATP